jgi:hypothetical protein
VLPLEGDGGPLGVMLVVGVRLAARLNQLAELTFEPGQPPCGRGPIGSKSLARASSASSVIGLTYVAGRCSQERRFRRLHGGALTPFSRTMVRG